MQPAPPDHQLWTVTTDEEVWIHLPDAESQMTLEYKGARGGQVFTAVCGVKSEAALYLADEFNLDDDWCDTCKDEVERQRQFVDAIKNFDMADLFKGMKVNVPTFIVPSKRHKSKSRDRLYD